VRRSVIQVQDLLKHFVNLAGHENANVPLLIGWRKQNDSAHYGANVRDKFSKFVWRARHKVHHDESELGTKNWSACVALLKLARDWR
jgi:hypothetical protein